jgi:hypothetical protein
MLTHVMLDTETWGLTPGSHLRSIGAVEFKPEEGALGAKFYANVASQPGYGLMSDASTREWWAQQSHDARKQLEHKQLDLLIALKRFGVWLASLREDQTQLRIWAHGPQFDCSIVDAAYRAVGLPVPWHYRSPRDCRTILEAAGMDPTSDFPPIGTEHNALDDAVSQALGVMEAFHRLKVQA